MEVWRADLLEASVPAWPRAVLSWYFDDDYPCPWIPLMCAVLDWFICCTVVRRGNSCAGVVGVPSVVARSFPGKGTCLLEGQAPCNASQARALALGI